MAQLSKKHDNIHYDLNHSDGLLEIKWLPLERYEALKDTLELIDEEIKQHQEVYELQCEITEAMKTVSIVSHQFSAEQKKEILQGILDAIKSKVFLNMKNLLPEIRLPFLVPKEYCIKGADYSFVTDAFRDFDASLDVMSHDSVVPSSPILIITLRKKKT
jgi:hypothetical protein